MEYPFGTASEIGPPFSPEEKGALVRLEAETVRLGSTHSDLIVEDDFMDCVDPLMSKAGICRANPASTEEKLAAAFYRETGPIVPEIQGRVHEGVYVHASQEEVQNSVFIHSFIPSFIKTVRPCFQKGGDKLLPQIGQKHR